jgi:uncharacterized protein (TIGR02646 family)
MIRLPARALSKNVSQTLKEYQTEVNAARSFAKRVEAAKTLFKKRNTTTNAAFRAVRKALDEMCSGARRCCYCEDSVADEVEHVRPKDWYPEMVFEWENYLYACGPCNGPKNNKFSVFHPTSGEVVPLERVRGVSSRAPRTGDPLLINPRIEEPLDYLELDLSGTFLFLPRADLTARDTQRAEYTIELLKLNVRDVLIRARRNVYGTYLARLEQYTVRKEAGENPAKLLPLVTDLLLVPHPTVWAEMKRQAADYPILQRLFTRSPEALSW